MITKRYDFIGERSNVRWPGRKKTALTDVVDTSRSKPAAAALCDSAVLADAYEQLRRDAVERPARTSSLQGLAVLVRKGMAAWINACALVSPPSAATALRIERSAADPDAIGHALRVGRRVGRDGTEGNHGGRA